MQISYIMPNSGSDTIVDAVSNIGISNHDHAANQIAFLDDGRMIWSQGGNTNAGIPALKIGGLDVRAIQSFCFQTEIKCFLDTLIQKKIL